MNSLVIGVVMLVVPGCCRGETLDTTGTSGLRNAVPEFETLKKQEPALAGSFIAERAGFDPAVRFPVHSISSAAQSATLSPLLFAADPVSC